MTYETSKALNRLWILPKVQCFQESDDGGLAEAIGKGNRECSVDSRYILRRKISKMIIRLLA